MALKRNDEAKLALDAGEAAASVLPDTDLRRLALYGLRGRWLIVTGDTAAGERLLDDAIAGLRKQIKDDHPLLAPLLLASRTNR